MNVRYLFSAGELEGGQKRATDPNWSLKVYKIDRSIVKKGEAVLYYLKDGREELMVIPRGTELPPTRDEIIYLWNKLFFVCGLTLVILFCYELGRAFFFSHRIWV